MNTSMWVRSLISKQYSEDKFFKHVAVSIGKEFEADIYIDTRNEIYEFGILGYYIKIKKEQVQKLQKSGLYFLDKCVLDELKKQGFKFDIDRSQYIQCCYGFFNKSKNSEDIVTRFNQIFNIDVQEGSLFYPCCGMDTYEPLSLFLNTIKEFHFASGREIKLPALECGIYHGRNNRNIYYEDIKDSFSSDLIPFAISLSNKDNYDVIKKISEYCFVNFKYINIDDISTKEVWKTKFSKNKKLEIYCHKFEGILSLMNVEDISVFYYRVNEINEGKICKSSFNWFSLGAFNLLLEKMVDKALIIVDGEDPGIKEDVPWSAFWREDCEDKFLYNNREFTYIGECGEKFSKMKVWQVKLI